jgi:GTP cyclohydrolase II
MISTDIKRILMNKMTLIQNPGLHNLVLVGPVKLPIQMGDRVEEFKWYTWLESKDPEATPESVLDSLKTMNLADLQQSSVLVYGDFEHSPEALVRMHSICHTGDIFGSKRCDCGYQLRQSLRMIAEHGSGALFYLAHHEGRGIGLFSKSLAYLLQQEGLDTVEANEALGFEDDSRSYEQPIRVLETLRSRPVTLITNNPRKLASLKKSGLAAEDHLPLWGDISDYNRFYLATKVAKSGHIPQETRAMA